MYARRCPKWWKVLLRAGCYEAAAGLLGDLVRMMHYADVLWPTSHPNPRGEELLREWREDQRKWVREALRELLGDPDGSAVESWYRLYRDDPSAFQERARQYAKPKRRVNDSGLWADDEADPAPR
jgi:hypothetical protein